MFKSKSLSRKEDTSQYKVSLMCKGWFCDSHQWWTAKKVFYFVTVLKYIRAATNDYF